MLTQSFYEQSSTDKGVFVNIINPKDPPAVGSITIEKDARILGDPPLTFGTIVFTWSALQIEIITGWATSLCEADGLLPANLDIETEATWVSGITRYQTNEIVKYRARFRFAVGFFGQPYIEMVLFDEHGLHWTSTKTRFELSPCRKRYKRIIAVLLGKHRQDIIREKLGPFLTFIKRPTFTE